MWVEFYDWYHIYLSQLSQGRGDTTMPWANSISPTRQTLLQGCVQKIWLRENFNEKRQKFSQKFEGKKCDFFRRNRILSSIFRTHVSLSLAKLLLCCCCCCCCCCCVLTASRRTHKKGLMEVIRHLSSIEMADEKKVSALQSVST